MLRAASLPFVLRREQGVVSRGEVTSTVDELHGLLRLEGDELKIQWRLTREVSHVGREIRSERSLQPISEATIPLAGVGDARVRRMWKRWWFRPALVLTAADLQAFDGLVGDGDSPGLVLEHPAQVALEIRKEDREQAMDFASQLRLAVSEHLLEAYAPEHRRFLSDALPPLQSSPSDLEPGEPDISEARSTATRTRAQSSGPHRRGRGA